MATKKKANPKKAAPKKPARPRVTLDELATNAVLKACASDEPPRTLDELFDAAADGVDMPWWLGYGGDATVSLKGLCRELIISGAIVKVKGVYRRAFIGGPGNEELPEPLTVPPGIFRTEQPPIVPFRGIAKEIAAEYSTGAPATRRVDAIQNILMRHFAPLPEITNPPKVQTDEADARRTDPCDYISRALRPCPMVRSEHNARDWERGFPAHSFLRHATDESDAFSRTVPMTKAQATAAKRGRQ